MSRTHWVVLGVAALVLFYLWRKGKSMPTTTTLPSEDLNKVNQHKVDTASKLWSKQGDPKIVPPVATDKV